MSLDYEIISTGSKGNSVRIDNILIDMGLPFKSIKDQVDKVDYLFLTHKHGDHYKVSNLKHFRKKVILAPTSLAKEIVDHFNEKGLRFKKVIAVEHSDSHTFDKHDLSVDIFRCYHDVDTVGYAIKLKDQDIIYATDTSSTIDFKKGVYDYIFIEANYDNAKLKRVIAHGNKRARQNLRHLSKDKSIMFYLENSHKKTKYIELHKSSQFY